MIKTNNGQKKRDYVPPDDTTKLLIQLESYLAHKLNVLESERQHVAHLLSETRNFRKKRQNYHQRRSSDKSS